MRKFVFFIQSAHHWAAWHNVFEEVKKESVEKNIYILKYEDLVSFPERTIKHLFKHLSIEYEDGIINSKQRYFHPVANNYINTACPFKLKKTYK